MERARELEPLSKSVILNYFAVRQYRGEADLLPAIVELAESLEEQRPVNTRLITAAYFRKQDYQKVVEFGESVITRDAGEIKSDYIATQLAISYFKMGDRKNTKRFVDHLEKRSASSTEAAYRLALVHSAIGDKDRALALLEQAFERRDDRMVWIKVEPEFENLRSDPRFQSLTAKMRLA
jgi:tetratricopeptide (TPR) repeat protein